MLILLNSSWLGHPIKHFHDISKIPTTSPKMCNPRIHGFPHYLTGSAENERDKGISFEVFSRQLLIRGGLPASQFY